MNGRDLGLSVVMLAMLYEPHAQAVELDDRSARQAAIDAIQGRPGGIPASCAKTRRKEAFEEELFGIRRKKIVNDKLNETLLVYEVVNEGCYSIENSSLVIHLIDHPGTFGYVVVDQTTSRTFRLWPDPRKHDTFNSLVADMSVDIVDESAALGLATLYLGLVNGPADAQNLSSQFELRQVAERSFYNAFGEPRWTGRFEGWWQRFRSCNMRIDYPVAQKKSDGWLISGTSFKGFEVTIPRTKVSGHPRLVTWSLHISQRGAVAVLPSRVVCE